MDPLRIETMRDLERGDWGYQVDAPAALAGDGVDAQALTSLAAGGGPECIDLRALPAPQPLERGLAAADALPPGGSVVLLTPQLPMPLLQLLEARGFRTDARLRSDGSARVVVRRA
jgi:hypothetical protein